MLAALAATSTRWSQAARLQPISVVLSDGALWTFSEGTRFELEPGTHARATAFRPDGADVVLEEGVLKATVVHRPKSEWHVFAGPVEVRVTGTRFLARWSPRTQTFALDLNEGAVEVRGPSFPEGRSMHAGQHLEAQLDTGAVQLQPLEASPAPSRDSAVEEELPPTRTPSHRASRAESADHPDLGWKGLARAGRYPEALEQVSRSGFAKQCLALPPADLLLLADVARFSQNKEGATLALKALRRRFPRRQESATAAFTLGELSFDSEREYARAAGWFSTYLEESPLGPLAQEAMGRLVESSLRAGDKDGVKRWGNRYLERYPTGPHAQLVQHALHSP